MRKSGVMVWCRRVVLALLALIVLLVLAAWMYLRGSLAQLDGQQKVPGLDGQAKVERDEHGVPLISGTSRLDVAYATGYVHAQDRFFQMDLLRRVASGELSEMFGSKALEFDKAHRLHRFRARAEAALKNVSPEDRVMLDRYVAGVNDGLAHLKTQPFEYTLAGVPPRPWAPADSLLVVWAMYFDLQGSQLPRELARGWIMEHTTPEQRAFLSPESTQWDAPLDAGQVAAFDLPIPATAPAWLGKPRAKDDKADAKVAAADMLNTVGSNNWAVSGSRTADGAAIVDDDMHLGIQLPTTWYRAALRIPDGKGGTRRVVGVTLPGAPLLAAGSNGHVAWGFTNSYGDYMDLIQLDTDPSKPGQVRTQAGWETPVVQEETILVKGQPAEKFLVRETSLGPIREAMGHSYAIHWVAHVATPNLNLQKLEAANTLDEAFATAATAWMPSQNLVAGDDKGNIGWTIVGPLPKRAPAGVASTYPLKPDDAAGVWTGWLAPDEYPKVVNPASGQVATANSRQLLGKGSDLLGDGGFDLGARTHQVRDDLSALGAKTDVKKAYEIGLDDRAVFLSGWRDRAIDALDAKAIAGNAKRAEMLQLLKNGWTGHASVDSVGYRLTRAYMYAVYDVLFEGVNGELAKVDEKASMAAVTSRWPVVIARLLDEKPAGWLPPQYASWEALKLAAADRVIADLTKDGKPLSAATWGQRNTAASAHPFASSIPVLGRYLKVPADMLPGDAHMPRVSGPTFGQSERLSVSPGREEQGIFNMPAGQSGHPLSPYFLDGRAAWVAGTPTPLLPGPTQHTLEFVKQ
jgi:penicillin amidase